MVAQAVDFAEEFSGGCEGFVAVVGFYDNKLLVEMTEPELENGAVVGEQPNLIPPIERSTDDLLLLLYKLLLE